MCVCECVCERERERKGEGRKEMEWGDINIMAEETLKSHRFLFSDFSFRKRSNTLCLQLALIILFWFFHN